MRAAILKYVIEIYRPVIIKDGFGSTVTNWELYKKTRADIKVDNGNKIIEAQEIISDYAVTFVLRDYHKIDETMQIYWNNHKYDIISILPNKDYRQLNISCRMINE